MVIKLRQQSTFRRYAAKVLSPFLFLLFSMCNYAINWCDKLPYILAYKSQNLSQNLDLKVEGATYTRVIK